MKQNKKEVKKKIKEKEVELYPSEEQGILPDETSDKIKEEMELGEKNEDVYSKEGRELLEEEDEIEPWEEGFMEGAADAGQLGKDALTGEPLMDADKVVEIKIKDKVYRFTNQKNADKFRKKLEKK